MILLCLTERIPYVTPYYYKKHNGDDAHKKYSWVGTDSCVLHLVGLLLNSIHDARTHVYKIYVRFSWLLSTLKMTTFNRTSQKQHMSAINMISHPAAIPMWNAAPAYWAKTWSSSSCNQPTSQPITTHNVAKSHMSKSPVKYQSWLFFTQDLPSKCLNNACSARHISTSCIQILYLQTWMLYPCPMISLPLADHAQGLYRGADKSLAWPGRKHANVSVRMAWISFGAFPRREKNLMTARVLARFLTENKVVEHKVRVLIFSTTYVWSITCSKQK